MAKTRRMPRPFKYRGGWRVQVTLSNGKRPYRDCDTLEEAKSTIPELLAEDTPHEPELNGPTRATLAAALNFYASQHTIAKDGYESELTRINHYLAGAKLPLLRCEESAEGQRKLTTYEPAALPSGWQAHIEKRRALRAKTYATIHELASKPCSQIKPADIRRLMTTMTSDGLSDSTVQKEIALLRHMFNVAASEWSWEGFKNPTDGFKLGKSKARFVFLTEEQKQALWHALADCDNPYFWPLVACSIASTMRRKSLLEMTWEKTDLDGRVAQVPTKTGTMVLPLSQPVVDILRGLPRHASGRVFPMTKNAVDMAWDGVRIKAGVPTLQFRDLRHLGATEYARRGLNAHQLKAVLGHKTLFMAETYVNLVHQDVLDAVDAATAGSPIVEVPPPTNGSGGEVMNGKRSERLVRAVKEKLRAQAKSQDEAQTVDAPVDAASSPASHSQDSSIGTDANAPAEVESPPREDSAPAATVIPFAKRVA